MKKRVVYGIVSMMLVLCMSVPVHAMGVAMFSAARGAATSLDVQNEYAKKITGERLIGIWGEAIVGGELPKAGGFANAALEQALNSRIGAAYNALLAEAGKMARSIIVGYEVVVSGDYISILLNCKSTGTFAKELYSSVVLNARLAKLITIDDVLGVNGTRLANRVLSDLVKATPDRFNAAVAAITGTHDFYMEDGALVLLFDQFEIAPGSAGVIRVPILLDGVVECVVSKNDYYQSASSQYGVKMIAIRPVVEVFGYTVTWNAASSMVELSHAGAPVTSIQIGENSYYRMRAAKRRLETAPELTAGKTHVPISFFEEILGLFYHVNAQGDITFTVYASPAAETPAP